MNVTRYKCSILAVDDDPSVLAVVARQLAGDFDIWTAQTIEHARAYLGQRSFDIVLCDLTLPDGSGLELLDWVLRTAPRTARVLISGTGRIQDAVDAINHCQVHRIVLKPWRAEDLLKTLRSVSRTLLLERSHEQLLEDMRKMNEELEQRVQSRTLELERANFQLHQQRLELEQANEQLRQKTQQLEIANRQLQANKLELEEVNRQLKLQQEELKKLATTDELTGIWNRREIEKIARNELERRHRCPTPVALILIDADHFGQINRDYSLTAGDQVLRWLTGILQSSIRTTDHLGRVGGEEFMIVAPHADAEGAEKLAERLRANVEASHTIYRDEQGNNHVLRLTISLGVAVVESDTFTDFDRLRALAADAEKEAKAAGRNRVVLRVLRAAAPVL